MDTHCVVCACVCGIWVRSCEISEVKERRVEGEWRGWEYVYVKMEELLWLMLLCRTEASHPFYMANHPPQRPQESL